MNCVLVPFYRGAVVFEENGLDVSLDMNVLVPFYRGAVVFDTKTMMVQQILSSSRPLLSRSGCISYKRLLN